MHWVNTNYPGTGLISSFGGVGEDNLRAPTSVVFGFARLLATGAHNPAITGYSDTDLTAKSVRLIESFANTHAGNGSNWGGVTAGVIVPDHLTAEWQGALWVDLVVAGAKLISTSLTNSQQARAPNCPSQLRRPQQPPHPDGRTTGLARGDEAGSNIDLNGVVENHTILSPN